MRHKSQVGEDMRQIPSGFSVHIGPLSRSTEDSKCVASSSSVRLTHIFTALAHIFATLTHIFAVKTAKEKRECAKCPHFFLRRLYASQSILGKDMVHNMLNNLL